MIDWQQLLDCTATCVTDVSDLYQSLQWLGDACSYWHECFDQWV